MKYPRLKKVLLYSVPFLLWSCDSTQSPSDVSPTDLSSEAEIGDRGEDVDQSDLFDQDIAEVDVRLDAQLDIVDDAPYAPPFDPTVCGATPHTWLPPSQVGSVVTFEEMLITNVTPSTISNMLEEAGYEDTTRVEYGVRNFELRYVTQDRGELVEATAVVGVPVGLEDGNVPPVAVWLHGTSGFMDDCAPSTDPLGGIVAPLLLSSQGYVTVSPDYIGMLGFGDPSPPGTIHSYLVAEPTAIGNLDAIRATLAAVEADEALIDGDPERIVLLGGSQGGHAAFAVELYAPYYAPELNIIAAAALVPPSDLIGQATYGTNHVGPTGATLVFALVAAWKWYGLPEDLSGLLTNEEPYFLADELPDIMSSACSFSGDAYGDLETLSDIYTEAFLELGSQGRWDEASPWGCFLTESSMGRTSIPRISDTPFLTTYSELDELVITSVEREAFTRLCGDGYRLEYLECAGLDHTDGAVAALPFVLDWLDARLADDPWDEADICQLGAPVDCSTIP